MSPPSVTYSLLPYTDGNWFFKAKPTMRFRLEFNSAPVDTYSPSGRCFTIPANTLSKSPGAAHLPSFDCHLLRARHGRQNFSKLRSGSRIGLIVNNADADKFGNGFFEQFQPFPAQFGDQVC